MLTDFDTVRDLIWAGRTLVLAGDERLLRRLPAGRWIGGTIPYFMGDAGGVTDRAAIHVDELPAVAELATLATYDLDTIHRVAADSPDNGYTVLIIPAFSPVHARYASEAPGYDAMAAKVVAGWVSGVHLDDAGERAPFVFDGRTGEAYADRGVALHVSLPAAYAATLSTVNVFERGDGDEITFPETAFYATECLVDGEPRRFADYILERGLDIRVPLVTDDLGPSINVSIQAVEDGTVRFFAPVFEGAVYRFATPLEDYAGRFEAALPAGVDAPALACNCVLNYLYGELEGRRTGGFRGPMTFGEIGQQLLNQTLVYVTVDRVVS